MHTATPVWVLSRIYRRTDPERGQTTATFCDELECFPLRPIAGPTADVRKRIPEQDPKYSLQLLSFGHVMCRRSYRSVVRFGVPSRRAPHAVYGHCRRDGQMEELNAD